MNCITIQHCIVRQWAGKEAVSRYNYCIVTEAKRGRWALAGRVLSAQGARGACKQACVGVRAGAAGSWARKRGAQWARRRAERHGRARGARKQLGDRRARQGLAGARQGAAGAQAGRAGWPWAVHSVHSAYFRSVLTRYCF